MNQNNNYIPQDNKEAMLLELNKKAKTGNILRRIGIGVFVAFGAASIIMQILNAKKIDKVNDNLTDIQDTVDDISGDVYDIMEQGCDGGYKLPDYDDYYNNNNNNDDPFYPVAEKPVVYIYDNQPGRQVEVSLKLNDSYMTTMWPKADNIQDNEYTWNVTTSDNGKIFDNSGNEYSYIFWEASNYKYTTFDQGFCVKGSDTSEFLREKLREIGLTPEEYNEFIVYWAPQMENNEYNIIRFEGLDPDDAYNNQYQLSVTDGENDLADSTLRVFMVWQAADEYQEIEPQSFQTFEREGFTVVEWGGTEVK